MCLQFFKQKTGMLLIVAMKDHGGGDLGNWGRIHSSNFQGALLKETHHCINKFVNYCKITI